MPISSKLRKEIYKERSTDTLVALFTLTHHTWDEPLRLTTSAKDVLYLQDGTNLPQMGIRSRGEEYLYIGVGLQQPNTQEDSAPEGRITFSNVSQEVAAKLMIVDTVYPRLTIEIVAWSDPDTVENEWPELSLSTAGWNESEGDVGIIHKTASQEAAPFRIFNPAEWYNVHVI